MTHLNRFSCAIVAVMTLVLSSCSTAPTATPVPTTTTTPAPTVTAEIPPAPRLHASPRSAPETYSLTEVARETAFEVGFPTGDGRPDAPVYSLDPEAVHDPSGLGWLSENAQKILAEHGFVVVPSQAASLYEVYREARARGLPAFVTTDVMLHTTRIIMDYTLQRVESDYAEVALTELTERMLGNTLGQVAATTGRIRLATDKNLAYFGVAARLIDPSFPLPERVRGMAESELTLIEARSARTTSPLFYVDEDYSQYVPRGYYGSSAALRRYFRTMAWYGRMPFRFASDDSDQARRDTRQAILITLALLDDPDALAAWQRIYEPVSFLAGWATDLNFYDYAEILQDIFGDSLQLDDLNDDAAIDAFMAAATERQSRSQVQSDPSSPGFRFMGRTRSPDSYVFHQTTDDRVPDRFLAGGLDLLAALGSDRALEIQSLATETDTRSLYAERIVDLRTQYVGLSDAQWSGSLQWVWLRALSPLLDDTGKGHPTFMWSTAWSEKGLQSAMSVRAAVACESAFRRQSPDEIARRAGTAVGYVEPYPDVYARLASVTDAVREGLAAYNRLAPDLRSKLSDLEALLSDLSSIAARELGSEELTSSQAELLRGIASRLDDLVSFERSPIPVQDNSGSGAASDRYFGEQEPCVASLYYDPVGRRYLQGASGEPMAIYVLVPVGSELTLAQGAVTGYYEFERPEGQELTAEEWLVMARPDRPTWVQAFIAPE